QIDRVAHRQRGGGHDVVDRPARRRNVRPGAEVARFPVAVADGFEEVVLAALYDDHGISARAIRNTLILLLEIVAVVDVDGIGVGLLASHLSSRRDAACGYNKQEHGAASREQTAPCFLLRAHFTATHMPHTYHSMSSPACRHPPQ